MMTGLRSQLMNEHREFSIRNRRSRFPITPEAILAKTQRAQSKS